MTESQRLALLRTAREELARTQQGHVQWVADGKPKTHWLRAEAALARLEADLEPSPVPNLGPVWRNGKSVLLHDLTHATTGIPLYPAFDDAFRQGEVVIAPEAIEVISPLTSSNPGDAFYALGRSKLRYWFGHLDRRPTPGTKFAKGDAVGKVCANTIGGGPHVHCGINVELLLGVGRQLAHHTDYTHGALTVGEQLRRLL